MFGLLCSVDGCPVAVEVFEGSTADPSTLSARIDKLRARFGLGRVDSGRRPRHDRDAPGSAEEAGPAGLDWITALRAPAIRELASSGMLQPSLFDERDLAEARHPDFPGERLIACRNPLLAGERARKREDLLQAAERDLGRIAAATRRDRNPLAGRDRIGLRAGRVVARHRMAKHFDLEIADDGFSFRRSRERIDQEARLDGFHVIRTSLPESELGAEDTVRAYKRLGHVERAFRSFKTVDLKVRPVHHYRSERVRAHVLLCMLAYHVEWHMRRKARAHAVRWPRSAGRRGRARLRGGAGEALAGRAPQGRRQALPGRSAPAQLPHAHRRPGDHRQENRVQPRLDQAEAFDMVTRPTPLQRTGPRPARRAPAAFPATNPRKPAVCRISQ